ncbi:unnamed protein product [Fusarium venenatum]|uniref:Uncharacterized protein n=1 Tax=Fusarium venenatum TaxID=56646 RepID=A0A2L2TB91_9HYPO|nr:uncharacterized protein FVRRES_07047 [Fusarium venenatum]CEI62611.1 unnamed protein product [Fusarium venenatum]
MSNTSEGDETGLRNMAIALMIALPITIILLTTCGCCYFWRIRKAKQRKRIQRSMGPRPPAYSRDPPISLPAYLPKKPEQAKGGECVEDIFDR